MQAASSSPLSDPMTVDTGDLTYGEFDLDFFCRLLEMASPRQVVPYCHLLQQAFYMLLFVMSSQ